MVRANLGQLLGNVGEKQTPKPANLDVVGIEVDAPQVEPIAAKPARSSTPTATRPKKISTPAAPSIEGQGLTYLRYVRKETRLREDQQNRLTLEARRLNRAKKNQGARITENSLIRVAIDLLLAQIGSAVGDDEDAIRKSMTS